MKKFDDLAISKYIFINWIKLIKYLIVACPLGSFFYNGSCYFYFPPKQADDFKGIGFSDVSVDEGIGLLKLI